MFVQFVCTMTIVLATQTLRPSARLRNEIVIHSSLHHFSCSSICALKRIKTQIYRKCHALANTLLICFTVIYYQHYFARPSQYRRTLTNKSVSNSGHTRPLSCTNESLSLLCQNCDFQAKKHASSNLQCRRQCQ
jgi:hypothetical protein